MKRIVLLLLALSPSAALALDCDKAITTPDINECAHRDYQKSDAKLNDTYQRVIAAEKAGPQDPDFPVLAELVEAQRSWVKFRDANCNAVFDYWHEGTILGLNRIVCLQMLTDERTRQLERQFLHSPIEPSNGP